MYYLGVSTAKLPDEKGFEMSEPFLIDILIKAVNFDSTTTKSARDNVPVGFPLLNKAMDNHSLACLATCKEPVTHI